ncbi:MAG: hypothetical protein CVU42_05115 [Chloroflexi bacterium HGW-Chloroflexi-4]|jgi:hypothetical protein|nr:MAG: hypothetical protein CVU42_05115 [Chloroflexi bacterium HGW-Chloroflexi-4]
MNIPDRSVTYNIEPINLGSESCEALTSYFVRLTQFHALKPIQLLSEIFHKPQISPEVKILYTREYSRINGMDDPAKKMISALNSLTGRKDLNQLTLEPWKNIIRRGNLLRSKLHFCEYCFLEQKAKGIIYIPLLWCVKPVVICSKHKRVLHNFCPQCKKQINILSLSGIQGYCPICGWFLGDIQKNEIFLSTSPYDEWMNRHFAELIKNNDRPTNLLTNNSNNKQIFPIFKPQNLSKSALINLLANKFFMDKDTLQKWGNGNHTVPLYLLLQKGYYANLSPFKQYELHSEVVPSRKEILIHNFYYDQSSFIEQIQIIFEINKNRIIKCPPDPFVLLGTTAEEMENSCPECHEFILDSFTVFSNNLWCRCLAAMNKAISEFPKPTSIKSICQETGVTRRELLFISQDLYDSVISNFAKAKYLRRQERKQGFVNEAISKINEIYKKQGYITDEEIRSCLVKPGYLLDPIIRIPIMNHVRALITSKHDDIR